jgi:hypothetical protein
VNVKAFFSEALGQALELGIGTPEDVIKHVTPDLLATYLPKPLWARLLTACLGASRVDATLSHELARRGERARYGLATMCIGVGQGISLLIERAG